MKKNIIQVILLLITIACIIGMCVMGYKWYKGRKANSEIAKIAKESLEKNDDDSNEPLMDFKVLQEVNPDIYAYIIIPGTDVDYPILQSDKEKGEDYYLDHNLDDSKGYPGCVYTQMRNSKDFTDPNTVIYGHNMKDGSMFASLHDYENDVFLKENQYIYIYTPTKNYIYQIYAAYEYDDRLILDYYGDFSNEGIFESYIQETFEMDSTGGVVDKDVSVESTDRIITLSTCTTDDDKRYLVNAVMLSDQEKNKALKAKGNGTEEK